MVSMKLLFCIAIGILGISASQIGEKESRSLPSILGGFIGSGIATAGKFVAPDETARAACEEAGLIDPEYRKGVENPGLFDQASTAAGQALMTGFHAVLPSESLREGCITAGYYHPDRQIHQQQGAGPTIQLSINH